MGKRPKSPEDPPNEYDDVLRAVGMRLREARLRLKLTQAQLAEKARLKQQQITELESGLANISLRTLAKMADVLEINIREFLPAPPDAQPSIMGLTMLQNTLDRVEARLSERSAQDTKRAAQDAELLSELRSLTALRLDLEQMAKVIAAGPQDKKHESGARPPRAPGSKEK